jgi:hypothetical protein
MTFDSPSWRTLRDAKLLEAYVAAVQELTARVKALEAAR